MAPPETTTGIPGERTLTELHEALMGALIEPIRMAPLETTTAIRGALTRMALLVVQTEPRAAQIHMEH